jgi:hypothetical protein
LDWSADLFTVDRTQYIIVSHTASLYSIVMYGREITDESRFLRCTIWELRERLAADDFTPLFRDVIGPSCGRFTLAKRQDRRVIGSMNELIFLARFWLSRDEIFPYDLSSRLNEILLSYIGNVGPRERLREMIEHHPRG